MFYTSVTTIVLFIDDWVRLLAGAPNPRDAQKNMYDSDSKLARELAAIPLLGVGVHDALRRKFCATP